jgi:hypothetical protein
MYGPSYIGLYRDSLLSYDGLAKDLWNAHEETNRIIEALRVLDAKNGISSGKAPQYIVYGAYHTHLNQHYHSEVRLKISWAAKKISDASKAKM